VPDLRRQPWVADLLHPLLSLPPFESSLVESLAVTSLTGSGGLHLDLPWGWRDSPPGRRIWARRGVAKWCSVHDSGDRPLAGRARFCPYGAWICALVAGSAPSGLGMRLWWPERQLWLAVVASAVAALATAVSAARGGPRIWGLGIQIFSKCNFFGSLKFKL
jgi:hypothetical protein